MENILKPAPPSVVMAIFDSLPAELRAAISRASFAHDPRIVASRIGRGVRPGRIVAEIETFERRPQPWL